MRRLLVMATALLMMLGACSDSESDTGTATEPEPTATTGTSTPPTSVPATTAAPATTEAPITTTSTTPPPLTTTTVAPTTTAPATTSTTSTTTTTTTTVPPAVVTTGEYIPDALGRDRIPWFEVGAGWYLALYDSTFTDGVSVEEGPTILYLVDGDGPLYEVAAWSPEDAAFDFADRRRDGSTVLLYTNSFGEATVRVKLLDVATGAQEILGGGPIPTFQYGEDAVRFTRPTGRNLVMRTSDGTTETLARYTTSGSLLATLYTQPDGGFIGRLEWLYGTSGTDVVVGHAGGAALVANDGTLIRDLWVPQARACEPVRWWADGVFLATCRGQGPAFPHDYYGELWLLRTDGTVGEALTVIPPGEVIVVDFGYADAWPTPSGTRVQWVGDCSAASVHALNSDGTGTGLPNPGGEGFRMVDYVDGRFAILSWASCGADGGALYTADANLGDVRTLIPRIEGVFGVSAVVGLATVYA